MEKVIAALWAKPGEDRASCHARLRADLPAALQAAGASKVRLNLRDAEVDAAAGLIQRWQDPQQDAVVQFWLPSANRLLRGEVDRALDGCCAQWHGWVVAESTIIPNTAHPVPTGTRGWGWSQASFISFRPDLSRIDAKVGDTVKQGDTIAAVGATGRATGPHLHWGMNWFDVRIDPLLALERGK